MSRKRYTPEQIISMLREAEVALAQGQSVGQACRTLGVSEQSYYRWRKEYGLRSVGCAPSAVPTMTCGLPSTRLAEARTSSPVTGTVSAPRARASPKWNARYI